MKVIIDIDSLPCKQGIDCSYCKFLDSVGNEVCNIPEVLSSYPKLKKNKTTSEDLMLKPNETLCEFCIHENICRISQYGEPYRIVRECNEFKNINY